MVVAGVFLVARLYPVFHDGLDINVGGQHFNLIAVIGGITIVIAAALAFVQADIKKVLAYSTVSQLGYMMMGLGVGAWVPAVFHIFTHAFFKCCLFLCAGSVSHTGSHHSFDMKKDMGGLAKKMPVTAACWIIATLALCGVPFFSGFFSKDEIIDNAHNNGYHGVLDHRSGRRVPDHGVHDPGDVPRRSSASPRRRGREHDEAHVEDDRRRDASAGSTAAQIHAEGPGVDVAVEDVSVGRHRPELVALRRRGRARRAEAATSRPRRARHDAHARPRRPPRSPVPTSRRG